MGQNRWQHWLGGALLSFGLWGALGMIGSNVIPGIQAIASSGEQRMVIQSKGTQIRLNGQLLRGSWAQWKVNGTMHLGIESMTLERSFGMVLRNGASHQIQGVSGFDGRAYALPIHFVAPYRYLDMTAIAQTQGWQFKEQGNTLELTTPKAQIIGVRQGRQFWGERLVFDLDQPLLWQQPRPNTLRLHSSFSQFNAHLASAGIENTSLPFSIKEHQGLVELTFPEDIADADVFGLNSPPRLVMDLRTQPRAENRVIQWLPGVRWYQQAFSANSGAVRVTWLELDPSQQSLALRPITPVSDTVIGLSPMVDQGESNQAIAAINAGFFNRNNQYPLGVVQRDSRLLSGPILGRGAVAWDNQGNWVFDRLSLAEDIVGSNGDRLSVELFNSGYVKAGVALYDRAWGRDYTTNVDNEIILRVSPQGEVIGREEASTAGAGRFTIPQGGYLLVFRSFKTGANKFPVGSTLARSSRFNPAAFSNFEQIAGGGPLLLKEGRIVLNAQNEQFSRAFAIQSASRSAIARTRDGRILLATLHGAAAESAGATLTEWANILQRLGATDALNLDGGGSSALVLGATLGDRHPATAGRVNNGIGLFLK